MTRDDNPDWLRLNSKIPDGQRWIVRARSSSTNHHRIVSRAHGVDVAPCLGASYPLAVTGGSCDPSVKTAGQFKRDKGATLLGLQKETCVITGRFVRKNARRDLNPCVAQQCETLPSHTRITVFDRGNDACHPGGN